MSQPQITGDQEGIAVWNKLGTSAATEDQTYFRDLCKAAEKYQKVFFTDAAAQRAKKLNNQKTYFMEFANGQWTVSLFLDPK